jgi:hypothetical protein
MNAEQLMGKLWFLCTALHHNEIYPLVKFFISASVIVFDWKRN